MSKAKAKRLADLWMRGEWTRVVSAINDSYNPRLRLDVAAALPEERRATFEAYLKHKRVSRDQQ